MKEVTNGKFRVRVFDPLYGAVEIDPADKEIFFSPEVQRLRYVRLCNINSIFVTGASEPNRFEHSLGVYHLAKEWARHHYFELEQNEARILRLAALLHDIQTGPFGHSFQYILEDNKTDDVNFKHQDLEYGDSSKYHQSISANKSFRGKQFRLSEQLKNDWALISDTINGEGKLGSLISGSIDLDNIDNVIRLAMHLGIADKKDGLSILSFIEHLDIVDFQLVVSKKAVPFFEKWYAIRQKLYEYLLLDWGDFSAKGMLTKAIEESLIEKIVDIDDWILTDNGLITLLSEEGIGEYQYINQIINDLQVGNVYYPITMQFTSDISHYKKISTIRFKREFEKEFKELSGLKGDVIFHSILDWKKTNRSISFIEKESKRKIKIGDDSKKLLIGVFSSKHHTSKANSSIYENICLDLLSNRGIANCSPIHDPLLENAQLEIPI